jgi:hypothetical protein
VVTTVVGRKRMNIAIDFDDTYTRDPFFWNIVIAHAFNRGHKVYCVTARADKNDQEVLGSIGKVVGEANCYFTAMQGKRAYMYANGIKIDVWVDDTPDMIVRGIDVDVNDGKIYLP